MTYANMASMPTQTSGSSPVLASDWNTFVRDNFADIRAGHVVCTSGTRPSSGLIAGTMVFETDTSKIMVYNGSSWVEALNLSSTAPAFPNVTPVGSIMAYAGAAAPTGWLLCNGLTYNGNVGQPYNNLYTAIGTAYGGTQPAFNVPNLQGRVIVGYGSGTRQGEAGTGVISGGTALTARTTLGAWFGDERSASHSHSISGSGTTSGAGAHSHTIDAIREVIGRGAGSSTFGKLDNGGSQSTSGVGDHSHTWSFSGTSGPSGSGLQENLMPSVVLNYIIKF